MKLIERLDGLATSCFSQPQMRPAARISSVPPATSSLLPCTTALPGCGDSAKISVACASMGSKSAQAGRRAKWQISAELSRDSSTAPAAGSSGSKYGKSEAAGNMGADGGDADASTDATFQVRAPAALAKAMSECAACNAFMHSSLSPVINYFSCSLLSVVYSLGAQ